MLDLVDMENENWQMSGTFNADYRTHINDGESLNCN